jgi:integrase
MPRPQKIWYWKNRKEWYVEIDGVRHRLGPDKKEAELKFYALKADPAPKAKVGSLEELFVKFILFCKANRAAKTTRWYQDFLTSFSETFPNLGIRDLKPYHVQEWIDGKEDWSESTKRGAIVSVQRAFSWALRMGIVQKNPVAFMQKPEVGKRERMLSPDEYKEILSKVKDEEFRDYLETVWETGARPQEIRKVTAAHVDIPNARWLFPVSQAKGKRKPRAVYLSDRALEITKRLMAKNPDGPIFRNRRGQPWNASATNCRFRRLKETLGEKFCVYLFRHTRTTKALEAGLSTETVRELMGHQDARMLEKHYSHLSQNPAFLREQIQKITENGAAEAKKRAISVAPAKSKKKKSSQ